MQTRVWVWVWAGMATVGVGLVVKDAPTEATRLYEAPPTNTRKNGRALSSTIIVSQPIGFSVDPVKAPQDRPNPPKKSDDPRDDFTRPHYTAALSQETKKKIQDEVEDVSRPHYTATISQETKKNIQDEVEDVSEEDDTGGSAVVGVKDKIKFYTLECRVGQACSAIIPAPAPVTVRPSARAFSPEQLKQYLAQFNLRSGFDYSESFEDSGNPDLNPTPAPSRSAAASERSLGSHYDNSNFWPGSEYRPRPRPPGRGSVYKYQPYRPTVASVHDLRWDKFTSGKLPHRVWSEYFRPDAQSSSQSSSHSAFRPRPQSSTSSGSGKIRPDPQDGQWQRYGTSTVAQLDKNSGLWIPVSSTTTQLNPLPLDNDYNKPNVPHPSSHSAPHRTQVKLTVLGVNDRRSYSEPGTEHVVKLPSALPGRPPALIETGGSGLPLSSPRQTSLASLTPTGVLHI